MIKREEIRQHLIDYIRHSPKSSNLDTIDLGNLLESLKKKYSDVNEAHRIARELLQEFVNNNLMFIGVGDTAGFPFFTLTESGKHWIQQDEMLPFDPQGYLVGISRRVPGLDSTTMTYLREAISTYNRRFFLSAAVALGVAAEHLILQMIEAYINAFQDPVKREKMDRRYEPMQLRAKYAHFKQEFHAIKAQVPRDLHGDFETHLDSIFQLIRVVRNDSGHPRGEIPEPAMVMANLQAFSYFALRVTQLESWFKENQL